MWFISSPLSCSFCWFRKLFSSDWFCILNSRLWYSAFETWI
jgi:hypothetical protein